MTTFSLRVTPGGRRTVDPVAMITLSKVTSSVLPSARVTVMALGPVNDPRPSYSVTLFFFIR